MDSGCVGGVSVCDDSELLIWGCGADGLGHGDGGGQYVSVIGEVVSGDVEGFG